MFCRSDEAYFVFFWHTTLIKSIAESIGGFPSVVRIMVNFLPIPEI